MLSYCFESSYIPPVLARCKRNDLAVIDTEGQEISYTLLVPWGAGRII